MKNRNIAYVCIVKRALLVLLKKKNHNSRLTLMNHKIHPPFWLSQNSGMDQHCKLVKAYKKGVIQTSRSGLNISLVYKSVVRLAIL